MDPLYLESRYARDNANYLEEGGLEVSNRESQELTQTIDEQDVKSFLEIVNRKGELKRFTPPSLFFALEFTIKYGLIAELKAIYRETVKEIESYFQTEVRQEADMPELVDLLVSTIEEWMVREAMVHFQVQIVNLCIKNPEIADKIRGEFLLQFLEERGLPKGIISTLKECLQKKEDFNALSFATLEDSQDSDGVYSKNEEELREGCTEKQVGKVRSALHNFKWNTGGDIQKEIFNDCFWKCLCEGETEIIEVMLPYCIDFNYNNRAFYKKCINVARAKGVIAEEEKQQQEFSTVTEQLKVQWNRALRWGGYYVEWKL